MLKTTITECSKELTKIEQAKLKMLDGVDSLDAALENADTLEVQPTGYAILHVVSPKNEYDNLVVFTADSMYYTGSTNVMEKVPEIMSELEGEQFTLVFSRVESRNYANKYFIQVKIK